MALAADGTLYVANAYERYSQVLSYSSTIDSHGRRHFLHVVADRTCESVSHPYSLVFSGQTLFVSNQDTGVVSTFTAPKDGAPAHADSISSYLTTKFPSKHFLAATFVACSNTPDTPRHHGDPVKPSEGGLAFRAKTGTVASHAVRGLAVAAVLYVCDEQGDRVTMYDPVQGTYLGEISGRNLTGPVDVAIDPTTGAVAIASAGNQSLYSVTPPATFPSSPITVEPTLVVSDPRLDGLSGLAYDANGELYINARKERVILKLDGTSLAQFGTTFEDTPEVILYVP
jgi:hypothetical protein